MLKQVQQDGLYKELNFEFLIFNFELILQISIRT